MIKRSRVKLPLYKEAEGKLSTGFEPVISSLPMKCLTPGPREHLVAQISIAPTVKY